MVPMLLGANAQHTVANFHTRRGLVAQDKWKHSRVGYASRTEYPDWAMKCLRSIDVGGGVHMAEVANPLFEIYPGCKTAHFAKLHKATGIPYK